MKHKTAELTGALLDAAVVKAMPANPDTLPFSPSTQWEDAGPLLEANWREIRVELERRYGLGWPRLLSVAMEPLPVFMRAFVAAKLGDEVDL